MGADLTAQIKSFCLGGQVLLYRNSNRFFFFFFLNGVRKRVF